MQKVIILRGCMASGKSTIAKKFRSFETKTAWLKVDNFKDFFAEDASPALEFVNGAAVATLEYLLKQGFSVVMEGVFQDTSAIKKAFEISEKLNVPTKVFEIETSIEILKKRDLERPGTEAGLRKPIADGNISKIYNVLKGNPYPEAINLNTESNNLEECKKIIDNSF